YESGDYEEFEYSPGTSFDKVVRDIQRFYAGEQRAQSLTAQFRFSSRAADEVDPRSDNFKKWFGNSKVVDENGNPKVVYHGTPSSGFSAFDIEHLGKNTDDQGYYGEGFYFTDSPKTANAYSLMIEGSGGYPVYLRINNPLYLDEADYEKNGILLNLK